jgi:hypothetical protein
MDETSKALENILTSMGVTAFDESAVEALRVVAEGTVINLLVMGSMNWWSSSPLNPPGSCSGEAPAR